MGDLPVQVRRLDDVPVGDAQRAHPCAGEVRRRGTAETAAADDEDAGGLEAFLTWIFIVSHRGSLQIAAAKGEGGGYVPWMPTSGRISCLP